MIRRTFILTVASLAIASIWGCGSSEDRHPPAGIRAGSPKLTLALPAVLIHECRGTGRRLKSGLLFCPPVVPRGPIESQNNLKTTAIGGGYELNFVSPSLAGLDRGQPKGQRHHLGHWRFVGGPPDKFRFALEAPGGRGRLQPIAGMTMSGVPIDLYERRATDYDIDEGHVFTLWSLGGRTYELSLHGFENRPLLVSMTRGLVAEIVRCGGPPAAHRAGVCHLVFGPG